MAGISSKAAGKMENKVRFNGYEQQSNEFSDGSGLEWYDYKHRYYDNQIGRFFVQDGLAHEYVYYSPYQFAGNEVPNAIDLDGLEPYRPNAPRYGQSNFRELVRSYRQVNSYVPREASSYRTSARYIPNQSLGSAARPANIYEPIELGTGQQHTGPYITRGNNVAGNGGAKMTDGIDYYLNKIEQAKQITDNIVSMNGMQSASSWTIEWKSKEAEASFNAMESEYQGKVNEINSRYQLTAFPGAGASQEEVNKWVSGNQETALRREGALQLLGPSPKQQIINRISSLSGFILKESKTKPLPEVRQGQ